MVRSELVERVAELHPYLQRRDVERAVETIFGEIGNALARGARTEIRGFGSFAILEVAQARKTPERNPAR